MARPPLAKAVPPVPYILTLLHAATPIPVGDAIVLAHRQHYLKPTDEIKLAHGWDPGYGSDFLTGGTASASSEWPGGGYVAAYAFDDNEATRWSSADVAKPHWVKYDLGVGVSKTAAKLRLFNFIHQVKDFKLQGSNNDSDWDDILSETSTDAGAWQEWTFVNATAYRYYRILVTSGYAYNQSSIWEIELMEALPF